MMNPLNWNQLRVVDDVNSVRKSSMCEFVREFGVRFVFDLEAGFDEREI